MGELFRFLKVFPAFGSHISQSNYSQGEFSCLLLSMVGCGECFFLPFFFLNNVSCSISHGQKRSALCCQWETSSLEFLCKTFRSRCTCVIQMCNCYSSLCVSGVCECSDFTTGMTCEHCQDGYYGNALIGTPGDCQPCPCPDRSSCAQIAETGQVFCTNCPAGQTGDMSFQLFKMNSIESKQSK